MPRAPRKCPHPGCDNRITNARYCDEHKPVNWSYGTDRTSSWQHQQWKTAVLRRCKRRCEINGPRCIGTATEADHIVPVAEGGTYDLSNGQGACHTCHAEKTQEEAQRGLRRTFKRGNTPAPF